MTLLLVVHFFCTGLLSAMPWELFCLYLIYGMWVMSMSSNNIGGRGNNIDI